MKEKIINVTEDFNPKPYGRFHKTDGDGSGEDFRKSLVLALTENDKVKVILDDYNRYAPSFLDESFGGLIFAEGFTLEQLKEKLTIEHSQLPSLAVFAWDRIKLASKSKK